MNINYKSEFNILVIVLSIFIFILISCCVLKHSRLNSNFNTNIGSISNNFPVPYNSYEYFKNKR